MGMFVFLVRRMICYPLCFPPSDSPLSLLFPRSRDTPHPRKAVSPGEAPAQPGLTLGAAAERGGATTATAPSTLPPT